MTGMFILFAVLIIAMIIFSALIARRGMAIQPPILKILTCLLRQNARFSGS